MAPKEELRAQLSDAGMSTIAGELAKLGQEALRISGQSSADENLPIAASKFGGLPDLPPNTPWPGDGKVPLSFIGQINLADISMPSALPKHGLLSFFYDSDQRAWGFDPKDKSSFRVLFFPSSTGLHRAAGLERKATTLSYKPLQLTFLPFISIPYPRANVMQELLLDLEDEEVYSKFFEGYYRSGPVHQLLGWPNVIQNEMELKCQLVTNGLYLGDLSGYKDPRRKELEQGAQDWILLLQVDSDDDATMTWGDVGMLYFWIRRQDLQHGEFANAWCILQCY